jgi:hypothetical protein
MKYAPVATVCSGTVEKNSRRSASSRVPKMKRPAGM